MDEQELKKKLAEWAEFEPIYDREDGRKYIVLWLEPSGLTAQGGCPNFTQSLDACVEHLVPKLSYWSVEKSGENQFAGWARTTTSRECFMATAPSPALALCLAIEKLIMEISSG